ncbi:hypothetical protein AGMMS4952_11000 [Spirochaetia bacterium]|nr:hypothetical protein AGMMS4952_11000 [Spirochaetia bacterium]
MFDEDELQKKIAAKIAARKQAEKELKESGGRPSQAEAYSLVGQGLAIIEKLLWEMGVSFGDECTIDYKPGYPNFCKANITLTFIFPQLRQCIAQSNRQAPDNEPSSRHSQLDPSHHPNHRNDSAWDDTAQAHDEAPK